MVVVHLICGRWMFQNNRWLFGIDNKRGKKKIGANEGTAFGDFVKTVIAEYNIDSQLYEVELSYMFPKRVLSTLPENTPPVDVGTRRQLDGYLEQLKTDEVQLCVELKTKGLEKDEDDEEEEDKEDDEDEDDDDEDDRFDWCDDSDGASSGDEDFTLYGLAPEGEANKKNFPSMKTGSTLTNAHVKLELSALNLAVGQRFESKDALVTRLKILSVLHQFDFKVARSRPDKLVIKCWVEGCSWRVRATPVGDSKQFTIRVFVDEHSCSVTQTVYEKALCWKVLLQ